MAAGLFQVCHICVDTRIDLLVNFDAGDGLRHPGCADSVPNEEVTYLFQAVSTVGVKFSGIEPKSQSR
jgi:hypothetical protein